MKPNSVALLAILLVLHGLAAGQAVDDNRPIREGPRVLPPTEAGTGFLVPNVTFRDRTGKTWKLSDFQTSKFLVIAFTNTTCPLCKKYAPSLARLEKEYAARGVAFLFVNPTATDAATDVYQAVQTHGWKGPYCHDRDGLLTAAFRARSTTETFLLDSARTVLYRGAIDDQYGLGYALDAPRQRYLARALDALLLGQQPAIAATEAPGCVLDVPGDRASPVPITYHERISRIVQNNCLECHRKGGLAPFSLERAEDLASHKGMIRKVVERGTMPPWFAAPPARGEHSPWSNDRSLSAIDRADLLAWLAGGLPAGDVAAAPLPRQYPEGWQIGKPDAVLQIPQPIEVKAEGTMRYQHALVETRFDEDKWVQALEVQPTAREVVHHVLVHVRPKGDRLAQLRADATGRDGFFAIYVPGTSALVYPEGFAKKLPKGASLLFGIHYTPNGTATKDQTKLGLIFAPKPPEHEVHVAGIASRRLRIPPGADNHAESASLRLPFDANVLSFAPHMHLRGKAFRYEATLPDGKTETLLDIPRYDFNWQLVYRYAAPPTMPRGTTLKVTGWYDNSKNNPANPDPAQTVFWGPQTYDEMLLGYVEYYRPRPQADRTR